MFLFADNILNIGLTVGMGVVYIGLVILANAILNKREKDLKSQIIWLYIFLLVLLFVFVGLALWFFEVDYGTQLNNFWVTIKTGVENRIGAVFGTIIVIFISMIITRGTKIILKRITFKKAQLKKRITTIVKLINSIVRYMVIIVASLIILSLWGVNVGPALAGLGILGLVIGLGAQKLIQDFIAGFFIIFEHQFDIGDIIEVNGFKGEVIDIGLKTTRMKNWKQDVKIFSNGSITELINYSIAQSIAIVDFGISYSSDVKKTMEILNKELPKFKETNPNIVDIPIVMGVTELANSSVNLRVIVRTAPETQYGIERSLRQTIKEILDANGIEIPFPQVVVHNKEKPTVHNKEKTVESDKDKAKDKTKDDEKEDSAATEKAKAAFPDKQEPR